MSLTEKQKQKATNAFFSGDWIIDNQMNRALASIGIDESDWQKWRIDFWKNGPRGRGIDACLSSWLERIELD